MNYFAVAIIVMFVGAAGVEFHAGRMPQFQIYIASAWLNFVFLTLK